MVMRRAPLSRNVRGVSMVEVLVTLVIVALGLLGLAGLQVRLQATEVESYQRTQALMVLTDLQSRVEANRLQFSKYSEVATVDDPVGAGMTCPTISASSTRAERDVSAWCNTLQGAAETSGGSRVGAMIGGRGCVEDLGIGASGEQTMRITIAWQGLTPLAAPPEPCGADQYDGTAGSSCINDLCRRAVSTIVRLANLK
jgi:type IV pilus assembly protein PilV